jgi:hypothetical protein
MRYQYLNMDKRRLAQQTSALIAHAATAQSLQIEIPLAGVSVLNIRLFDNAHEPSSSSARTARQSPYRTAVNARAYSL